MASNYEIMRNQMRGEFVKYNQQKMIKKFSLRNDGEYIYIPRKENNKKSWGENTNSRKEIHMRNSKIYEDYKRGIKVKDLAEKYFLSDKSIQRIVLQKKNEI